MNRFTAILILIIAFLLVGCSGASIRPNPDGLKVVATTTIVGDVVRQIGGDKISLEVLFPIGADPHTFEARPQDVIAISNADILFLNGLELEHTLEPLIEANAKGLVVEVSEGIEALPFEDSHEESVSSEEGHDHAVGDPHVWMDPNNVQVWVQKIVKTLSDTDPDNKTYYSENGDKYLNELANLNQWIKNEVININVNDRKLVTDHETFGYFADEYGFRVVGLVVNSITTGAAPSARELSELEDKIKQQNVKAVFVGSTVSPTLAQQVASDTGVKLVVLYTESLGAKDSGVDTYIRFMKKNVELIVDGLN